MAGLGMRLAHMSDGTIIMAAGDDLATGITALGKEYPSVRRVLVGFVGVAGGFTAIAPLLVTLSAVGVAIAVNHQVLDSDTLPDGLRYSLGTYIIPAAPPAAPAGTSPAGADHAGADPFSAPGGVAPAGTG
ncbi:MAG: hypothetical protein ACRDX8_07480 [Acidimicrobiales bacterium]